MRERDWWYKNNKRERDLRREYESIKRQRGRDCKRAKDNNGKKMHERFWKRENERERLIWKTRERERDWRRNYESVKRQWGRDCKGAKDNIGEKYQCMRNIQI